MQKELSSGGGGFNRDGLGERPGSGPVRKLGTAPEGSVRGRVELWDRALTWAPSAAGAGAGAGGGSHGAQVCHP